jgi:hypothetical protein
MLIPWEIQDLDHEKSKNAAHNKGVKISIFVQRKFN